MNEMQMLYRLIAKESVIYRQGSELWVYSYYIIPSPLCQYVKYTNIYYRNCQINQSGEISRRTI